MQISYIALYPFGTAAGGNKMKKTNTQKLVVGAILSALVLVLQLVAGYIKIGPASITLTLAPIIVGGALYGKRMGAFLGLVFAIAVLVEPGTAGFYAVNWWATIIIVTLKSVVSAYLAAVVYEAVEKKNKLLAVILSGITLPVLNTGIFVLGSYFFFVPVFNPAGDLAGFPLLAAIVLGIIVNFAVELGVNLVLAAGITTVIKAIKK